MKSRMILLMSVTLIAASCGSLVQQSQQTPRYADAIYTAPQTPTRTVAIYSQDDFKKLAANMPKPIPDSLDIESDGYSVTYEWKNPYFWGPYAYYPYMFGPRAYYPEMYSFGGPMGWRSRCYFGTYWNPYYDPAYSFYWDWYYPYGDLAFMNSPWYYDSWYFGHHGLWDPYYYGYHDGNYGGAGHPNGKKPGSGMREPDGKAVYHGSRSFVQGGGRSDSGTRLPGGRSGYTGSVTRSGTSAVGMTPRSEARTNYNAAGGYYRTGSPVTTERGYAPNSTGNYSRGGSSSGSSVSRSGSTYRSSDSGSYSRGSDGSSYSRSSSSYSSSSSHSSSSYSGGSSSSSSSHSSSSSGGGGGGRR